MSSPFESQCERQSCNNSNVRKVSPHRPEIIKTLSIFIYIHIYVCKPPGQGVHNYITINVIFHKPISFYCVLSPEGVLSIRSYLTSITLTLRNSNIQYANERRLSRNGRPSNPCQDFKPKRSRYCCYGPRGVEKLS